MCRIHASGESLVGRSGSSAESVTRPRGRAPGYPGTIRSASSCPLSKGQECIHNYLLNNKLQDITRGIPGCHALTVRWRVPKLARFTALAVLLLAVVEVAWCAPGDVPSNLGAFAFADSTGTLVLAQSGVPDPETIHVLLAASGRQFPVEYVGFQKASAPGSGRDAARNFSNCEGSLFHLVGARIWPDETCFLATDSLLAALRIRTSGRQSPGRPGGVGRWRIRELRLPGTKRPI